MSFEGNNLVSYRQQTERQRQMSGVMVPSFPCSKCAQVRKTAGRRKVHGRWVCAQCLGGA